MRKVGLNGNKGNRKTRETGEMSICFDKEKNEAITVSGSISW